MRGQVDAYNALSPEAKVGARGKTILGEMQASLFFAETQANVALVEQKIKNKSLDEKEALAAYVSKLANKKYTAADIDADTDHITGELAVLDYTMGILDIEGAIAEDAAVNSKIAMEQGKSPLANEVAQSAMAQDAEGTIPSGNVENGVSHNPVHPAVADADQSGAMRTENVQSDAMQGEAVAVGDKFSIARTKNMTWSDQLKNSKRSDTLVVEKNTPSYLVQKGVDNLPMAIPKSVVTKAQSGKDISHSISDTNIQKLQSGIQNAIAVVDDTSRNALVYITNLNESGKPIIVSFDKSREFDGDKVHKASSIHVRQDMDAYLSKFNINQITVLNKNEFDTLSRNADILGRVQESDKLAGDMISQNDGVVNSKSQNNSDKKDLSKKDAEIAQERVEESEGADVDGAQQKGSDAKSEAEVHGNDVAQTQMKSPKANDVAQGANDVAKAQMRTRAEERAKKWAEWEKDTKPTAEELNTAREYVKGFDSLENHRRLAIIRMIRSADGKVDAKTLRGVANLMAMRKKNGQSIAPDLEFRFVEGISDKGLYTHVGGKVLVLVNTDSEYADTMRNTIVHELVHYIENKEGYKELAKFAKDNATAEHIAEIEKEYIERYEAENKSYTQADLDSEVVARLVGEQLGNEKFLARYAQKDDKLIKRIGRFLKGIVTAQKDDAELSKIAGKMTEMFDKALGQESVSESSGTKYDIREYYVQDLSDSEIDRYYRTGKTGHVVHKKNDIKELTGSAVLRNDSEIIEFVNESIKESRNITKGYGVVPKALSDKISSYTGNITNTENWFLELSSDDLYHSFREHHKAKEAGDLDLSAEELASIPKKIDGDAEILALERYKTQTTVKLGVRTESGDHYIVAELVSSGSQALRMKTAWKVSAEKYSDIKKGEMSNAHNRTKNSPAISDNSNLSNNIIHQNEAKVNTSDKKDLAPKKKNVDGKEKGGKKTEKKTEKNAEDAKALRKMSEEIAREKAKLSREQNAKVYTKQEIGVAVDSIEALTDIEVLRLANGMELQSLTRERREELASQIYVAMHDASAEGESGRGSVVVKGIATKIVQDIVDHERIVDEDGKSYHFKDVFDASSISSLVQELAQDLYESFAAMGTQTSNSSFTAAVRAVKEKVSSEYASKAKAESGMPRAAREVSFQATRLKQMAETQKRGIEDDGISLVTKKLGGIVDAKGNIFVGRVDEAVGEAERFFSAESLKREDGSLTSFVKDNDMEISYLIEEFKLSRQGREGQMLKTHEMQLLGKILGGMHKTIKEYNQVFVNGHWMDADKVAGDSASDITSFFGDKQYKNAVTRFLGEKIGKRMNQLYFYNILSPENVIEALEGYKNGGVLKTLYHSIRVAKQRSEHLSVQLKKPFAEFLDAKGEVEVKPAAKRTSGNKISPDMTDAERYEVLKDREISLSATSNKNALVDVQKKIGVSDDDIEYSKYGDKKKLFKKLGDEFSVYHKYSNSDIQLDFSFSKGNMGESVSKQGKNFLQMAKMLTCLDEVVENAIGIEVHNRNSDGYKADNTLENVYVLASAFVDGENILPVKLEIKKFSDKENTLYVAIALENIKKDEIVKQEVATDGVAQQYSPSSNISIAQFFKKINTKDESFLKYVPDGFLNEEQKASKKRALDKDAEKYVRKSDGTNSAKTEQAQKIDPTWKDEKGRKRTYRQKLNEKIVNVNGNEITLGEGIYLYMLTKREQSHAGLRDAGFVTYDENNQRKKKFKIEDVEAARDFLYGQFDASDKAYIAMAEEFFNKTSTEIKSNADREILGFTNTLSGYYVPIIRDRYSRMQGVTDMRQSAGSIVTVYNKSFNQNTVQNAKALEGKNIQSIINDHADGLADYKEMYLPLKAFDRVYNRRVTASDGSATTIREVLNNDVWNGSQNYFKNLFADIQGESRRRDGFIDDVVGKLRSGWVNSVLGLNLKVVATQTTSYVAANQVIEAKYLVPAMAKFVGNQSDLATRADKYSDIIEARSFDMGSLKAQGNVDKINELGKKSGFMIEAMDRRVCMAIFHAAELKAQDQGHGKVGTVENAKAAAKIADEVIYTTQAMTSQAERSALQRSPSEIAKAFSMFTSDTVKNLSHTWSSVMRYIAHSQRAKTDSAYKQGLKKDARKIGRSAATMAMTGIMLGLITQAFKYLYAKEEEEPEDKIEDFATDIVASTLNVFPIFSDICDKFVFGYDMSLNVFDIANDTIEDTRSVFDMAGKAMSGQFVSDDEIGKTVINAVKTYGTLLGVPLAPVERTVTGLLRRFAPQTVYDYDAMFKNTSYTADLKKAVESGDEALAEHILTSLYKNEATGVYASEELEEIVRLYALVDEEGKHPDVLPQRIGTEIEGVTLTKAQRTQFESVYGEASDAVVSLIGSDIYQDMTDEERVKAIKNTYKLYYNRAKSATLGTELSKVEVYSALLGDKSELYVLAQAKRVYMKEYKNRRGKKVTVKEQVEDLLDEMELSKAERLIINYALGYKGADNTKALLKHLNSLAISDEQKLSIATAFGFAVVKGKIVEKQDEND